MELLSGTAKADNPKRLLAQLLLHSASASSRPRIKPTVSSMPLRMTPALVSSRLAPARSSCLRPIANIRSAPVLVIGQPLSRRRSSAVI
eukprot:5807631-Prymnesium_polylepis.1